MGIILFFTIFYALFKSMKINTSWLWFIVITSLFSQYIYRLNTAGVVIGILIFKLLKEIFEW